MKKEILFLVSFLLITSVCWGAAADMAVTVAGAGDGSGTAGDGVTLEWDNAMSLAQWETDAGTACSSEAGDRYFVTEGTYTLNEAWDCTNSGTTAGRIQVIGVVSGTSAEPPTITDWANSDGTCSDCPLIAAAANTFNFEDMWTLRNLNVTTTAESGFVIDQGSHIINCKSLNSSGSANRRAFHIGNQNTLLMGSDGQSDAGRAVQGGNAIFIWGNWLHDSDAGHFNSAAPSTYVFNIFDNNAIGLNMDNDTGVFAANNTFYSNSTAGITGAGGQRQMIINNIFNDNLVGVTNTSGSDKSWFLDYNDFEGNGTPVTNVDRGPNTLSLDPVFGGADAGDFSIGTNLKAAAYPGIFGGGLTTGYLDTGAVQREEAGSAAATTAYGFSN